MAERLYVAGNGLLRFRRGTGRPGDRKQRHQDPDVEHDSQCQAVDDVERTSGHGHRRFAPATIQFPVQPLRAIGNEYKSPGIDVLTQPEQ